MAQEVPEGCHTGTEGGVCGLPAEALTRELQSIWAFAWGLIVSVKSGKGERMPDVGGIAGEQLRSFIERIERLEEEKRALSADIKDVYAEAQGGGLETEGGRA